MHVQITSQGAPLGRVWLDDSSGALMCDDDVKHLFTPPPYAPDVEDLTSPLTEEDGEDYLRALPLVFRGQAVNATFVE